jgi:hypothetical protein
VSNPHPPGSAGPAGPVRNGQRYRLYGVERGPGHPGAGPGGMTLTNLGDAAEAQSPDELGIAVRDAADQVTVALGGPPFAVRAKGEHG